MTPKIQEIIYRIIDSFLTEAKDQNGKERSLERLNQDRHLAAESINNLVNQVRQETIEEIGRIIEKMRQANEGNDEEVDGYNEAIGNILNIIQSKKENI